VKEQGRKGTIARARRRDWRRLKS